MFNLRVVRRTLILLELYKVIAGSVNAFFLQTILLIAIDMVRLRPVSIWSLCTALSAAMIGLLAVITRLIYWDSVEHRFVLPKHEIPAMVVLALETGLALLGMFMVTNQGHNDIRTVGCDKQAESPVANWTLICGMHVG